MADEPDDNLGPRLVDATLDLTFIVVAGALVRNPESRDAAMGLEAFNESRGHLGDQLLATLGLTTAHTIRWASAMALFLRQHAATAAAVAIETDRDAPREHIKQLALHSAANALAGTGWASRIGPNAQALLPDVLGHLSTVYAQEVRVTRDTPEAWLQGLLDGYEVRYG